ncbi:HIT-like domain-containing protein [Blakeslea trispora]|nr:HIT-like domain-containing protein [Blakeslea trispora]
MIMETVQFGKFVISPFEVFYSSQYCLGLVNLKPITPGHVLVVPKRVVLRYALLSIEEVIDLTNSASQISQVLKQLYSDDLIWLIQDGKEAGQTVPHVHLHIIPKRFSEWDTVENRPSRTLDDMKAEAEQLKSLLNCHTA